MSERFIAPALALWALTESKFFADEEAPFSGVLFTGDLRVTVIVGENASGKSLLFRVLQSLAKTKHDVTGITISIRERTGSGLHEMSHMRRAFMFGDEDQQSTGATSANVIDSGFKNAEGGSHGETLLMLDEPEMGLSDGYARALGEFIGQKSQALAECCHGVVVVTHNRSLVSGLVDGLGAEPAFVNLSPDAIGLTDWLAPRPNTARSTTS